MDSWGRKLNSSLSWMRRTTPATLIVGHILNSGSMIGFSPTLDQNTASTNVTGTNHIYCDAHKPQLLNGKLSVRVFCYVFESWVSSPVSVFSSFRALPSLGVWRRWGNQRWRVFLGNQTVFFLVASLQQGKAHVLEHKLQRVVSPFGMAESFSYTYADIRLDIYCNDVHLGGPDRPKQVSLFRNRSSWDRPSFSLLQVSDSRPVQSWSWFLQVSLLSSGNFSWIRIILSDLTWIRRSINNYFIEIEKLLSDGTCKLHNGIKITFLNQLKVLHSNFKDVNIHIGKE